METNASNYSDSPGVELVIMLNFNKKITFGIVKYFPGIIKLSSIASTKNDHGKDLSDGLTDSGVIISKK